jgi:uncharacterized membrane protein
VERETRSNGGKPVTPLPGKPSLDRLRARWRLLWAAPVARGLIVAAGLLVVATLAGLALLWPGSSTIPGSAGTGHTEEAKVVSVTRTSCAEGMCRLVEVEVLGGTDRGRSAIVTLTPQSKAPDYDVGQRVRVLANERRSDVGAGSGVPPADLPDAKPGARPLGQYTYSIVDYDRRMPMLWLAIAFAALVILAGRLRGLLSLVGLGASILVVTQFVVPAMLEGRSAFLVALVGSLAAMFLTIALTSGLSVQSLAASLGIALSLVLAAALGLLYVNVAHLNGSGSELAFTLSQQRPGLSLQGLVLAGFVIGALGVLADMAVTQASAVMALRRADPGLGVRGLYREAFTIGRDHLSATVNTLVFAYVGASLPLLLLFTTAGVTFTDAINGQNVAESVIATLVGAIGVVASVPFTTGLAALLAAGLPAEALPADHAHHH